MGPRIRELRERRGWTQSDFARQLQLQGWDIERRVLGKLEARRRCITDYEMLLMLKTLGATADELVPRSVALDEFY